MCSEYFTKITPDDMEEALGIPVLNKELKFEWGSKVNFFKVGPVLQKNKNEELELALKIFPTSPMPNSRLSGLEGQTDGNDSEANEHRQIKRIYEMRLWKDGFKNNPLLIPMSAFTEFAYWGKENGSALEFKVPKEKVLFVAGLAIKPFTPKGDATSGFSLITHTATEQMLEYHHRLIVLFDKKSALGYLQDMTAEERFNYIIENRYTGELQIEKLRSMAKGWEKRIENQMKKLNKELEYRKVLQKELVAG